MVGASDLSESMRSHAWKYFEIHASQRISIFNYFLLLSGVVAAGLAGTVQGSQRLSVLGVALGLLLALVSFVFWKLDQRVSFLIKRAEGALTTVEPLFPEPAAQLFLSEPKHFSAALAASSPWSRMWTYGRSFRFVFWAMGVFGIGGSLVSLLKFLGHVSF